MATLRPTLAADSTMMSLSNAPSPSAIVVQTFLVLCYNHRWSGQRATLSTHDQRLAGIPVAAGCPFLRWPVLAALLQFLDDDEQAYHLRDKRGQASQKLNNLHHGLTPFPFQRGLRRVSSRGTPA